MSIRGYNFSDVEGELCIHDVDTLSTEPTMIIRDWPTGFRVHDFLRNFNINSLSDCEVREDRSPGIYRFYVNKESRGFDIQLTDGGKTMPKKFQTLPYPCPKVKAGIHTRYSLGHWEKYLKTKGWIEIWEPLPAGA